MARRATKKPTPQNSKARGLQLVIDLPQQDLLVRLESALHVARIGENLPPEWIIRTQRLAELPYHLGFMAALGGALLAKATDERIDCLTHKKTQGPNAYQLRKSTEVLARQNNGRYDLGSQSQNPLNTSTFLNNSKRIDAFKVKPSARPAYEHFLDCMLYLNRLSSEQAGLALAAYLHTRMRVLRDAKAANATLAQPGDGLGLDDLIEVSGLFVGEDPENGRRGEAFVAAAFDCVCDNVQLPAVHSPDPIDIKVLKDGQLALAIEVKQKAVMESAGLKLAMEAKSQGANSALLVVISPDHSPLDRDRIRHAASREHGIAMAIVESIGELIHHIAVFGGGGMNQIRTSLPNCFLMRLAEHKTSQSGIQRWRHLVASRRA